MLVLFLSLMGWCCVDKYDDYPTPVLVDKQMLKLYTQRSLAEHTYALNEMMEKRARK